MLIAVAVVFIVYNSICFRAIRDNDNLFASDASEFAAINLNSPRFGKFPVSFGIDDVDK